MRIALVVLVLIGGTLSFGFWSFRQFEHAFENLSVANFAGILQTYSSFKFNQRAELISTSSEIFVGFATSTDLGLASTSPETPVTIATSTDLQLSFTFPRRGDEVYIGCTYPISWQSSVLIFSLEAVLVDAGTRESMGPIASGLARESTIEKESQNLTWKVGSVWPGAYYIKIMKINDVEAEFRSKVFEIHEMPEGIGEDEKINICRESSD